MLIGDVSPIPESLRGVTGCDGRVTPARLCLRAARVGPLSTDLIYCAALTIRRRLDPVPVRPFAPVCARRQKAAARPPWPLLHNPTRMVRSGSLFTDDTLVMYP